MYVGALSVGVGDIGDDVLSQTSRASGWKMRKFSKNAKHPELYMFHIWFYITVMCIYILYYRYVSKYIHKGLQQKWCLKAQFFGFLEWRPPFNFQLVVETGCGTCIEYFSIPPFCWYEKIIQTTFFYLSFFGIRNWSSEFFKTPEI